MHRRLQEFQNVGGNKRANAHTYTNAYINGVPTRIYKYIINIYTHTYYINTFFVFDAIKRFGSRFYIDWTVVFAYIYI